MFRRIRPFDLAGVTAVPHRPDIYIIYKKDGTPFYVGRSRVDIFARLWKHLHGLGSMRIKAVLDQGVGLNFEFQEMISVEQAEAILIKELGSCNSAICVVSLIPPIGRDVGSQPDRPAESRPGKNRRLYGRS
jgi:hypothetical protein